MPPIKSAKITAASDVSARLLAIGYIAGRHRLRMDESNRASGGDQGKQEKGSSEKLDHVRPLLAIGQISLGGLQMDGCSNANASVTMKAARSSRISFEALYLTVLDRQVWDL
jgi:hypothetical protein